MLTMEQKTARMRGIGGSDAGVVLGVNPFKTTRELFIEKRGEISCEMEENERMFWGSALEPVIASEYAKRTGRMVYRKEETLVHPDFDFILDHRGI